jgi:hypothetical protein
MALCPLAEAGTVFDKQADWGYLGQGRERKLTRDVPGPAHPGLRQSPLRSLPSGVPHLPGPQSHFLTWLSLPLALS